MPYRSKWDWRLRVTVTETIPIMIDYDRGIDFMDERIGWFKWDSARVNRIARNDFICPPIGVGLRDVLAELNDDIDGVYQILLW